MLSADNFLQIFQIAAFAVTLSQILIEPGEALESYGNFLYRLSQTRPRLAKPLGQCAKCLSGQIAFWGFGVFNYVNPFSCPLRWISYTCCTILLSFFLSGLVGIVQGLMAWGSRQ